MLVGPLALPEERLHRIRTRLDLDGRVLAADLAREFQTSEDTIRRDLRELAAAGLCKRVYGGALRLSPAAATLRERMDQRPGAKAALGRAAAALIEAGQTIFIDTGSTNQALAEAIPEDLAVTVVTNAPAVAAALVSRPRCSLIVIGGRVDPATGGSFGARAMRDLDGLRPDLCFVGTCALSKAQGLAVFDAEEAVFKRRVAEISSRLAIVATTEKLATVAPFGFAPLKAIDILVLEAGQPFGDADECPHLRIVHAPLAVEA